MKARSDLGQRHERQESTGLPCVYYNKPRHALDIVVSLDDGSQIGRMRSLSAHEVEDAAEQLVEIRDDLLRRLGRPLPQDDRRQFRVFAAWLRAA